MPGFGMVMALLTFNDLIAFAHASLSIAATPNHSSEGGDRHISGHTAVDQQYQCVHGRGRCGADDARAQGNGQIDPQQPGDTKIMFRSINMCLLPFAHATG